jgi:CBS domain-containing protein
MRTLRVRDVMTRKVIVVTEGTSFGDMVDLMVRHQISAIPVVDDEGGLLGMVSEADLISKQGYGVVDVVHHLTVGVPESPTEPTDASAVGS